MTAFIDSPDKVKHLAYLLSERLSIPDIAKELGISERSVHRAKNHPNVIEELDKILYSKAQQVEEVIKQQPNETMDKIRRFGARAEENLHQLQLLNLKLFKLLNDKIDSLTSDDIPVKLVLSSYKDLVNSYKIANEIEAEYLGVDHILQTFNRLVSDADEN